MPLWYAKGYHIHMMKTASECSNTYKQHNTINKFIWIPDLKKNYPLGILMAVRNLYIMGCLYSVLLRLVWDICPSQARSNV